MDEEPLADFARHLKTAGFRSAHLYEQAARRFLAWLAARNLALSGTDPARLHDYLLARRTGSQRPGTIGAVIHRLRVFFRHAASKGLLADDPTRGVSHLWLDVPGGFPAYAGVLRRIFRRPVDILRFRLPLFAPHWDAFLAGLLEQGYARHTRYAAMEHNARFHRYLSSQGVRNLRQVTPRLLEAFLRRRRLEFQRTHGRPMPERYQRCARAHIERFLAHASPARPRPPSKSQSAALPDGLLDAYLRFSRDDRGLSPVTRSSYRAELLRFRRFLGAKRVRDAADLSPTHLDAYLKRRARSLSPRGLQSAATALRSFLRYLQLDGRIPRDLAACVASPSRFSADLRPKFLPWTQVLELLDGAMGRRDRAILTLLACHGLRAREAAALKVADLDLDGHSLRLQRRKNGAAADIPLSQRAVSALRDYLAKRPPCDRAELFVTAKAPLRPLAATALGATAQRRLRAASVPRGGAYTLRHSFAKALLDRGAPLHDIGALLGHKSLRSTLIYTRVATEDLREVADNYAAWL